MDKYISRENLLKRLELVEMDNYGFTLGVQMGVNHAIQCVKEEPAVDVVEVTFCKDCRYYQDAKVNEKGFLICPASGMEITVTDFCSYGQRKIETVLLKSDAKDESLEASHD